jgi:predicted TIM-barrel fold metal-dependent hydrolase
VRSACTFGFLAVVSTAAMAQAPAGDFHQHFFGPPVAEMMSTLVRRVPVIDADRMIALLDSAGIHKAMVLSTAYMFGAVSRKVENEREKVRAENDWTAAQVSKYPDRLFAACSVNPVKDYALDEIARCARDPVLKRGLKMHFGNSDVRTDLPGHLEQMKRVFRAANAAGMAIIVHMHANIDNRRPYGAEQARAFLEQLLPEAPDVVVQIAHLAGSGGAANPKADSAVAVFAAAIARHDPRMKNVWFEVSVVVRPNTSGADKQKVADQVRAVGIQRVLYGTDGSFGANTPKAGWATFRTIPLTEAEFNTIAGNVAPYLRESGGR